jgi:hypothetical protein
MQKLISWILILFLVDYLAFIIAIAVFNLLNFNRLEQYIVLALVAMMDIICIIGFWHIAKKS